MDETHGIMIIMMSLAFLVLLLDSCSHRQFKDHETNSITAESVVVTKDDFRAFISLSLHFLRKSFFVLYQFHQRFDAHRRWYCHDALKNYSSHMSSDSWERRRILSRGESWAVQIKSKRARINVSCDVCNIVYGLACRGLFSTWMKRIHTHKADYMITLLVGPRVWSSVQFHPPVQVKLHFFHDDSEWLLSKAKRDYRFKWGWQTSHWDSL